MRAFVGEQDAKEQYKVTSVQHGGQPDRMVPTISALVHTIHHGSGDRTVAALLAGRWSVLYQPEELIEGSDDPVGIIFEWGNEPWTGSLHEPIACDQQWAYLLAPHTLHLYLMIPRPQQLRAFLPWASWPLRALPAVTGDELSALHAEGEMRWWTERANAAAEDYQREHPGNRDGR